MAKLMCPHCGWTYQRFEDVALIDVGLVPIHYQGGVYHCHCPGSEQVPRNAESDRRALWSEDALTAAVIAAARELVAHAEGDTEPTVDGYDLDRLRTALAALDAAKGGPTDA